MGDSANDEFLRAIRSTTFRYWVRRAKNCLRLCNSGDPMVIGLST